MLRKFISNVGELSYQHISATKEVIGFFGDVAAGLLDAARRPNKVRWRECFYYMDLCGVKALPIALLICLSMGIILGFQGALQLHKYGGDIFLADGVALVITIELGPLMIAMIAIGRAGSAFAAEIGTMKASEEVDAIQTMGLSPTRFLVVPKFLAMIVVIPILTIFGDLAGIVGGMIIGHFHVGLPLITYYNRTVLVLQPNYLFQGLIKSFVFSIIITLVGCIRGFQSSRDAQGVGRAATSAVITSIFFVILADTLLTILFSMLFKS